jgi:HK97 gp10 family phage protein
VTTTNIKGLAELQRALDSLPAKIEANIMRAAMRAGAKVIAKEAAANVNSVSGALAASVRFGARPNAKEGKVLGYVRAGGKAKKGKAAAFYAHMVEYGTAEHVIKARPPNKMLAIGVAQVKHPGAKKRPFMRPALDTHAQAALEVMREHIRKTLAKKHGLDVPAPVDPDAEE